MSEYTLDINGKRYELSKDFLEALSDRARSEYSENYRFSCWWSEASKDNYTEREWENNIHEEGDPILTIETTGIIVPWDRLDQLEAEISEIEQPDNANDDEPEELDSGNGMKTIDRPDTPKDSKEIFGRTHFSLTPHRFEDIPEPESDDPERIPQEPEELDEPSMIFWLPDHPDIEHTWSAGKAAAPMDSWIEWNVQKRAEQPRPLKDKNHSHDSFESLCRIHDCEVIGEYTPSNDIKKEVSGQVERKGEDWYNGDVVGDRWNK